MFLHAAYVPIKFVVAVSCCERAVSSRMSYGHVLAVRFGVLHRSEPLLNYYNGKVNETVKVLYFCYCGC